MYYSNIEYVYRKYFKFAYKVELMMKTPTFNQHFRAAALERIESIRLQYQQNSDRFPNYSQWQEDLDTIEALLPSDKKYLVKNIRNFMLDMNDEYDVKIFKLGFIDGILFLKDIIVEQNEENGK